MNDVSNLEKAAADVSADAGAKREPKRLAGLRKLLVLAAVVAAFGFTFTMFGDELSLTSLSEKAEFVRQYRQQHPVLVYAAALLIYVSLSTQCKSTAAKAYRANAGG